MKVVFFCMQHVLRLCFCSLSFLHPCPTTDCDSQAPATQPAPVPEPLTEPVAMDTASPTAEGEVPPAKRLRMEGAPLPPALVASPARIRS